MPDLRRVGWYDGQGSVRIGLAKGGIKASLNGRVENVLVYYKSDKIVIRSAEDDKYKP
jgi:hypothetical protein